MSPLSIPPTTAQRLKELRSEKLYVDYAKWISDKSPDPYFVPPYVDRWRESKTREFVSLLERLAKIGDQMEETGWRCCYA